jgi:hypothetical protein
MSSINDVAKITGAAYSSSTPMDCDGHAPTKPSCAIHITAEAEHMERLTLTQHDGTASSSGGASSSAGAMPATLSGGERSAELERGRTTAGSGADEGAPAHAVEASAQFVPVPQPAPAAAPARVPSFLAKHKVDRRVVSAVLAFVSHNGPTQESAVVRGLMGKGLMGKGMGVSKTMEVMEFHELLNCDWHGVWRLTAAGRATLELSRSRAPLFW